MAITWLDSTDEVSRTTTTPVETTAPIDTAPPKVQESSNNIQWVDSSDASFDAGADLAGTTTTEGEGFFSNVGGALQRRGQEIARHVTEPIEPEFVGQPKLQQRLTAIPSRTLAVGGEVLGGAFDVAFEGIKSTYKTLMPDALEEEINEVVSRDFDEVVNSDLGRTVTSLWRKHGKPAVDEFIKNHPEDARMLGAFVELLPQAKGAQLAKRGAGKVTRDIATRVDAMDKKRIAKMPVEKKENIVTFYDDKLVDETIEMAGITGFKAKTGAKKGAGRGEAPTKGSLEAEKADMAMANKAIINNSDNLSLSSGSKIPQTVEDFAEAVDQTKSSIWRDRIAPAIGATDEAGFRISTRKASEGLDGILNDRALIGKKHKAVREQAQALKDDLDAIEASGGWTAEEAQRFITEANKDLASFYKKVNPELDTELAMRAQIATEIRSEFNRVVDLATDVGMGDAKAQYKALLSIEDGVNRARNREFKKIFGKNTPSYFDLGTDWGILHGLVTLNPKTAVAAIGAKGIKLWQSKRLAPDDRTRRMFNKSEKWVNRQNKVKATIPVQGRPTPLQLEHTPRLGMGEDVSGVVKSPRNVPPTTKPQGQSFARKGQKERISFEELQRNPRFYKAVLDDPNASPDSLALARSIEREMTTTVSPDVTASNLRSQQR